MKEDIGHRCGGWRLSLETCRLGSRLAHVAFHQLPNYVSMASLPYRTFGTYEVVGHAANLAAHLD